MKIWSFFAAGTLALGLGGAGCSSDSGDVNTNLDAGSSVGGNDLQEPGGDVEGGDVSVDIQAPDLPDGGPDAPEPDVQGPDVPGPLDRPIEIVRSFVCDPAAVASPVAISDVSGLPGATIDIQPTATACMYDLVFRDADGSRQALSKVEDPGGYLLAIGGVAPSGDLVVCASNIGHEADPDAAERSDGRFDHRITGVTLECAARVGAAWTELATVVAPDGDYAAWIAGLQGADGGSSSFKIVWIRDFSYQFLNLGDIGRPDPDGIYETEVTVDAGQLAIGETTLLHDEVVPREARENEPWQPTAAELEEYGEWIQVDAGLCGPPTGCLDPDAAPAEP